MNTKARYVLILTVVMIVGVALWATVTLAAVEVTSPEGGAPTVVAYQGEVRVSGSPYTGDGHFKFAVVNAAGDSTYWSNDGTSTAGGEPTSGVALAVSEGLFSVLLGDTTLAGMTQPLSAEVFSETDRYLRVWFSTSVGGGFDQLTPDTRIAAVPYALQAQEAVDADTVDGMHASDLGTNYQNVVIVAQSGGDYTSVQAAIDSIGDAAIDNPYLVWVAPGVYEEQVAMKPYVHLQGAGQDATVISSMASSSAWPPDQATLILASDTSLRDLTLGNSGVGESNTALLATAGMTSTLVADVTARAQGSGVSNFGIVLSGSGTGVTLQQVTALSENGSSHGIGLVNMNGSMATLRGGDYTGRGVENGWGIFSMGSDTMLDSEGVSALGENGSNYNVGLYNYNSAAAVLRGGVFIGRGGNQTGGVANQLNSTLTAEGITTLVENGIDNYSLGNYDGAVMTVRGAVVTARGGTNNYALSNEFNVMMDAQNVTSAAENGSSANHGFWNVNNAQAIVRGGSFTGRGGENAWGIYNSAEGSMLDAEGITALGEQASSANYGLSSYSGATATLRGVFLTGRGGLNAHGIYNVSSGTTLEAESVHARGENGSNLNYGLYNHSGGEATLRNGVFIAHGGTNTQGIRNAGSETVLAAESVTALGEDGATFNYGFFNTNSATATITQSVLEGGTNSVHRVSGVVTVSNSRLVGSAVNSVAVTCVLVTRDTTISTDGSTCP